jgi:hypothetical protein
VIMCPDKALQCENFAASSRNGLARVHLLAVEEERRSRRHAAEDGGDNSKTNRYGALDAGRK